MASIQGCSRWSNWFRLRLAPQVHEVFRRYPRRKWTNGTDPEKGTISKGKFIWTNHWFSGDMLIFGGVLQGICQLFLRNDCPNVWVVSIESENHRETPEERKRQNTIFLRFNVILTSLRWARIWKIIFTFVYLGDIIEWHHGWSTYPPNLPPPEIRV